MSGYTCEVPITYHLKGAAYVLLALIAHEFAHFLTAKELGVRVKKLGFGLLGPYLIREPGTVPQNIAISAAGPLANLYVALLAAAAIHWVGVQAVYFGFWNLAVACVNLLPLPHSDGLRIVKLLRRAEVTL